MTRIQELERIIELKNQAIEYFMGVIEEYYPETEHIMKQIRRNKDEIVKCEHELSRLQMMGIA